LGADRDWAKTPGDRQTSASREAKSMTTRCSLRTVRAPWLSRQACDVSMLKLPAEWLILPGTAAGMSEG
jgi:hypothetical protein